MVKRLQVQDLQIGTSLQTTVGGTQASVSPIRAQTIPVEELGFKPLLKVLDEKEDSENALKELKELNAAETLKDPEYDEILDGIETAIKLANEGVTDRKERTDNANRIWNYNIEAGNLPKGSGPRTVREYQQRTAGLMAVETEGNLAVALEYLARGVDSEGNPIDREGAQKILEDIIRSGGEHPSVQTSFFGSEVYSRTTDQMLARGLSAYDAGIMKTQDAEQQRVYGATLRQGYDDGAGETFIGFEAMMAKDVWTPEDGEQMEAMWASRWDSQAFSKDAFINTAESVFRENLAILKKGGLTTLEAADLTLYVNRIADGEYKGLALRLDGSKGEDGRTPSDIIGAMHSSIAAAEESESSISRERQDVMRERQVNGAVLITKLVADGKTDSQIHAILATHEDTLGINDRGITETTAAYWTNAIAKLRDDKPKEDAADIQAQISTLEGMIGSGVSLNTVFAFAAETGVLSKPEGTALYDKYRGRNVIAKMGESPTAVGQAIQRFPKTFINQLDHQKLDEALVNRAKLFADGEVEEVMQAAADALNAQPGIQDPRDKEDFVLDFFKTAQEPGGYIAIKIDAFNEEVKGSLDRADTLISDFDLAKLEGDLPQMEELLANSSETLASSLRNGMRTAIQKRRADDTTIGRVNSATLEDLVSKNINFAMNRAAAGNSRIEADLVGRMSRFEQVAKERLGVAALELSKLPPAAKQAQLTLYASELEDTLAAELGITPHLEDVRADPTVEEEQASEFRDATIESRRLLARATNSGYNQIFGEIGSDTESGRMISDRHNNGAPYFSTLYGSQAVSFAQNLSGAEALLATSFEERNALAAVGLARTVFPLASVGDSEYRLSSTLGSKAGLLGVAPDPSGQTDYLEDLGFPPDTLNFLRVSGVRSTPEGSPEYNQALAVLKETADTFGYTVDVVRTQQDGFPFRSVTITATVDLSEFDHKPMSTAYFTHDSILFVQDLDPQIKSAFKEWGWPTEGEEYTERKELWIAQQKRLITMQQTTF